MKFKDLDEKTLFTWWERDHHHTGVKIGGGRVFCFDTLKFLDVHANKDVKELDKTNETLEYKVGRDGKRFLCSPLPEGKVLARRILLIGSEIMHSDDLKTVSPQKDGGEQADLSDVYITLEMLGKKIKDLETVFQVVKIAIEDRLSVGSSDNRIMSTSRIKKLAFPTE